MKVLKYSDIRQYKRAVREMDPKVLATAEEIVMSVRKNGDRALMDLARRLDGVTRKDFRLSVTREEIEQARQTVENEYRDIYRSFLDAAENIREFHQKQKENTWSYQNAGSTFGQMIRPIERVGVYIPGGRAFYPSSVLMNVIPAQIAGVSEIVLATPPDRDGNIHPLLVALADRLGVQKMFKMGGAQAIAALAYGTESVPPVSKITGPGNAYVIAAKKLVMGSVGIDSLAGPSEVMILADDSAKPEWIAMDLFAQAEHDPDTTVILVSESRTLIKSVIQILM